MKKICIHMGNLHVGGGLQVANSFLEQLSKDLTLLSSYQVSIFLSTDVFNNIETIIFNKLKDEYQVEVIDVYGLQSSLPKYRKIFNKFDLVFTLFGPDYLSLIKPKRIMGFAQPWIIYNDDKAVYERIPALKRLEYRFRFYLQRLFFMGADAYIVELDHVREKMSEKNIANYSDIYVAHNSLSDRYRNLDIKKIATNSKANVFRLGIISRSYSHKNLAIIPEVKRLLQELYRKEVEFFVTFTEDEFKCQDKQFQKEVVNLGPKKVHECIDTYLGFNGVFFPSLLECFSATPLEAMATGRALFASNRSFNESVCGQYAYYFDPLNPRNAAQVINDYIDNCWGRDLEKRMAAREHAINFSNPRNRALKYIEVIEKVLT